VIKMPKRKLGRFPNYGGKGYSQKPGTHGHAPRKARASKIKVKENQQALMPAAPVGRAITRRNQDPLPRR